MTVAIHLRIDGVDDMIRAFSHTSEDVARAIPDSVEASVKAGAKDARTTHRFKNQTGKLERSIRGRLTAATPGAAMGEMTADETYASFVEHGTAPHPIHPQAKAGTKTSDLKPSQKRRKRGARPPVRYLAFLWNGELVFRREVHHPGTDPLPFMGPAFLKCERVLLSRLERVFADAKRYFPA